VLKKRGCTLKIQIKNFVVEAPSQTTLRTLLELKSLVEMGQLSNEMSIELKTQGIELRHNTQNASFKMKEVRYV
jgi:hypothetical protein